MSEFSSNQVVTREDCLNVYDKHMKSRNQGYFNTLKSYAAGLAPHLGGTNAFTKEGWQKIVEDDNIFNKAIQLGKRMFMSNETLQKQWEQMMRSSRDVTLSTEYGSNAASLEGWGGGTAVYASSQGAFPLGLTPFVIGGWLASCRSEEIFQHIDNNNSMRLEFEYILDYLQIGDAKYYFPQAYRSGEMIGFNKLPKVDWVTPNTDDTGKYTKPEDWCGKDMFIELQKADGAASASAKGNLLEVSKRNKAKYGLEPNCAFTAIKFKGKDGQEVVHRVRLNYDVITGRTDERMFKNSVVLKNVNGFVDDIAVDIFMKINFDNGDFHLMVGTDTPEEMVVVGLKFDGKVSNIANEMTNIPTNGVEKFQFIRECEYRQYAKVSLNEYMADNFRIGTNNNISYAAYASDKLLQETVMENELQAEDFLISEVLDDDVDLDSFELTKKLGGFIQNHMSFTIGKFAPGIKLQDYKDALKEYVNDTFAVGETELNLPRDLKREWILLGYDILVAKFPNIKFENSVVDLGEKAEGSPKQENYGFAVESRAGYVDNLGRAVRIIGNTDSRWRDRGNRIFGALRTYDMDYPFLVFYPHAIRMFTAIDPDFPNRTSIHIGGREFRGHFAAAAVELALNGVLDDSGMPINNFDVQTANAKTGYEFTGV